MRNDLWGMRGGFTLMEMLVVIGIVALLIGASIGGYSFATNRAQRARGRELVSNVATALNVLYQRQNRWPPKLLEESKGEGRLTAEAAACLAVHGLLSLSYTTSDKDGETVYRLSGYDRFGIVSPWATGVIKRMPGSESGDSRAVPTGGTIRSHVLHFAVDEEGRGVVTVHLKGRSVKVRASAVVWSYGMNGVEDDYEASMAGRGKADDIYSWTRAQEVR